MKLEKSYLYQIYNQRKIFFKKENYLFFLDKIETYLSSYADIITYCLMPNHFYLMVLVKEEELSRETHTVTQGHSVSKTKINDCIGIMLRSYTIAINKQENLTGKLFKEKTIVECINCFKGNTPFFICDKIILINFISEKQYPQVCFDYIHQNPVKENMVDKDTVYEFLSVRDYAGLRNNKLINKEVALKYVDYPKNIDRITANHRSLIKLI